MNKYLFFPIIIGGSGVRDGVIASHKKHRYIFQQYIHTVWFDGKTTRQEGKLQIEEIHCNAFDASVHKQFRQCFLGLWQWQHKSIACSHPDPIVQFLVIYLLMLMLVRATHLWAYHIISDSCCVVFFLFCITLWADDKINIDIKW